MPSPAKEITISSLKLTLDQLLSVIRQLDEPSRARVARTLIDSEMDARFKKLIEELAAKVPGESLSDAEIQEEVDSVRRAVGGAHP